MNTLLLTLLAVCMSVVSYAQPTPDFNVSSSEECLGEELQFTDLSTSSNTITAWNWDFGDGSTSTDQNPTHTYTTPGTFNVSLTVEDADGSASEVKPEFITINPTPDLDPLPDRTECDSYILPAITGTNLTGNEAYYTATGGTGTQLNPGDEITAAGTTTIYIYDETATTPNCFDEESFDLTINNVNVSTTNSSPTLSADESGAVYQWLDCDENFSPINGATAQTYMANDNGNYAVQVTMNGCSDISECMIVNNIGLPNEEKQIIKVYPNPTTGLFFVKSQTEVSAEVFDALGRKIISTGSSQEHKVNLANQRKGVYIIRLIGNNINESHRIVVGR